MKKFISKAKEESEALLHCSHLLMSNLNMDKLLTVITSNFKRWALCLTPPPSPAPWSIQAADPLV